MDRTKQSDAITPIEYRAFQDAYDFFNWKLFTNSLPNVLVTLQRKPRTYGYFSPERFTARDAKGKAHELAMNPDHFGRCDEEILSTLAHEMAHVWQEAFGKPGRSRYHNKQWAAKMKEIGLHPSNTGAPGGKETGDSMSHYTIAGGLYACAYDELHATGFRLHWSSGRDSMTEGTGKEGDGAKEKKKASKTKFSCPECDQNAWGKPDSSLVCGGCYKRTKGKKILEMVTEDEEEDPV